MNRRIALCGILAVTTCAADAAPENTDLRAEIGRGQKIALMGGTVADSGPLGTTSYLLAASRDKWKHSLACQLGFAVAAMRRVASFSVGRDLASAEKQIVNGAFVIFSGQAALAQLQLKLSDQQMKLLFGPTVIAEMRGEKPFAQK